MRCIGTALEKSFMAMSAERSVMGDTVAQQDAGSPRGKGAGLFGGGRCSWGGWNRPAGSQKHQAEKKRKLQKPAHGSPLERLERCFVVLSLISVCFAQPNPYRAGPTPFPPREGGSGVAAGVRSDEYFFLARGSLSWNYTSRNSLATDNLVAARRGAE